MASKQILTLRLEGQVTGELDKLAKATRRFRSLSYCP
jgi:predicted transcriptional regulator